MHLLYIAEVLATFTSSDALTTRIDEHLRRVLDTNINSSSYKENSNLQKNRNLKDSYVTFLERIYLMYFYHITFTK
jgi:hypothetical protein